MRRHARHLARLGLVAGLAISGSLAGCFGSSPEPRYYAFEPATPARLPGVPYPFTLLVRRFDTALAYDRTELVYRPHEHELRFYPYRLWVARPGRMLSEVVANHLDALGLFEAVTPRPTERPAEYELRGEVLAIDELDPIDVPEGVKKTWQARLSLKLAVSSTMSGAVVWQHAFETVRDVARHDPRAVVEALAAILDDELGRIAADLDRTFARLTGTAPHLAPPMAVRP